jgi:competence protein ComEA
MTIDGLGEKRAGLIVAYRQQIGSYTDVSQIKNIKGIGDSIYEKVAPYLTV